MKKDVDKIQGRARAESGQRLEDTPLTPAYASTSLKTWLLCLYVSLCVNATLIEGAVVYSWHRQNDRAKIEALLKNGGLEKRNLLKLAEEMAENGGKGSLDVPAVSKSDFTFQAERLKLLEISDKKTVDDQIETAKRRYQAFIRRGKELKTKGAKNIDIYNYIVKHHGEHLSGQAAVSGLLTDGKGDCWARTNFSLMAVEDILGDYVQTSIRITNVKGADGRVIKHSQAVVTDSTGSYLLALPEARPLTGQDRENSTVVGSDVMFKAYLVSEGEDSYSEKENPSPPVKLEGIKSSSSAFDLPNDNHVEVEQEGAVPVDASPDRIFELDAYEIVFLPPEREVELTVEEAEKFVPRFSFSDDDHHFKYTVLKDPKAAEIILQKYLEKARKNDHQHPDDLWVDLSKLTEMSAEALEVFVRYNKFVIFDVGIGDLNEAKVDLLTKIKPQHSLNIFNVRGLTPELASKFSMSREGPITQIDTDTIDQATAKSFGNPGGTSWDFAVDSIDPEVVRILDSNMCPDSKWLAFGFTIKKYIGPETAKAFAEMRCDRLSLTLPYVDLDIVRILSDYKGREFNLYFPKGTKITPALARILSTFKAANLDLMGEYIIDAEAARELVKFPGEICLNGNIIPPSAAEIIKQFGDRICSMPEYDVLTMDKLNDNGYYDNFEILDDPAVAMALVERHKNLSLSSVMEISPEVLYILSGVKGDLTIDGSFISPDDLKSFLKKYNGKELSLSFNNRDVDHEIASALAGFKGSLLTLSIGRHISTEAAYVLSELRTTDLHVYVDGPERLSVIKILKYFRGESVLCNISTREEAEELAGFRGGSITANLPDNTSPAVFDGLSKFSGKWLTVLGHHSKDWLTPDHLRRLAHSRSECLYLFFDYFDAKLLSAALEFSGSQLFVRGGDLTREEIENAMRASKFKGVLTVNDQAYQLAPTK